MAKNINVQTLKTDTKKFFFMWVTILQPFLKLRKQEVTVLATLLYHRYKLMEPIANPVEANINIILFSTAYRKKIKTELDIEDYAFNNILSSLRKKKLVINNSISKKIIPNLSSDSKSFKLLYNFEIIQE